MTYKTETRKAAHKHHKHVVVNRASSIADVKRYARLLPQHAQRLLEDEYERPDGPRWTLVQWLKRHRLHNPTVRVIPN